MTWTARRFYAEVAIASGDDGFVVILDGRPVRTPAGAFLRLPAPALARAIAGEWQDQADEIRPLTMPLTRLAATALDRVGPARAAVIEELVGIGLSDLVCYRAWEPGELVARQQRCWQPLVDWIAAAHDVRLTLTAGVMPVAQPTAAAAALERAFAALSDLELTAVADLVQATGSAVIGLAVAAGRLDAKSALLAAELDACYQVERWGDDVEATARRDRLAAELADAARFLNFLRGEAVTAAGAEGEGRK